MKPNPRPSLCEKAFSSHLNLKAAPVLPSFQRRKVKPRGEVTCPGAAQPGLLRWLGVELSFETLKSNQFS